MSTSPQGSSTSASTLGVPSASANDRSGAPHVRVMRGEDVDGVVLRSVSDFLAGKAVLGTVEVVSGEGWNCYVRCVLHALGQIGKLDEVLAKMNETIAPLAVQAGVQLGSDTEEAIRRIILEQTGQSYRIHATDAADMTTDNSGDGADQEIRLLLTGAHYSLWRPDQS